MSGSGRIQFSPALDKSKWLRGVLMLLFWLILQIALMVLGLIIFIQFVYFIISEPPGWLRRLSASCTTYIWQILRFLGFASDYRPFPFSDWPEGALDGDDPNSS
ncbi:MAG: DUF4389 domain-containing protein [Gammaproteobacteria bacterium AqS3]|nr:DUF4389 domain-containing protein [Gammaproteobacteria bacterium AqS3]